mmetsp:Transcript_11916/g.19520  ORF Transcript_11916/g.19520 Transcript_11916/m.19520 type:complete len:326 (-) Transcript_11916:39-1016(-)
MTATGALTEQQQLRTAISKLKAISTRLTNCQKTLLKNSRDFEALATQQNELTRKLAVARAEVRQLQQRTNTGVGSPAFDLDEYVKASSHLPHDPSTYPKSSKPQAAKNQKSSKQVVQPVPISPGTAQKPAPQKPAPQKHHPMKQSALPLGFQQRLQNPYKKGPAPRVSYARLTYHTMRTRDQYTATLTSFDEEDNQYLTSLGPDGVEIKKEEDQYPEMKPAANDGNNECDMDKKLPADPALMKKSALKEDARKPAAKPELINTTRKKRKAAQNNPFAKGDESKKIKKSKPSETKGKDQVIVENVAEGYNEVNDFENRCKAIEGLV